MKYSAPDVTLIFHPGKASGPFSCTQLFGKLDQASKFPTRPLAGRRAIPPLAFEYLMVMFS